MPENPFAAFDERLAGTPRVAIPESFALLKRKIADHEGLIDGLAIVEPDEWLGRIISGEGKRWVAIRVHEFDGWADEISKVMDPSNPRPKDVKLA